MERLGREKRDRSVSNFNADNIQNPLDALVSV